MVEQFQVYITEFFYFLDRSKLYSVAERKSKKFSKKTFSSLFCPIKTWNFSSSGVQYHANKNTELWREKRLRFALFLFTTVLSLWSLQPYVTHLSPHGVEITKHRENRETWCLVLTSQFRILVSSLLRGIIIIHNNGFETEHVFKNKGVPSKIQ